MERASQVTISDEKQKKCPACGQDIPEPKPKTELYCGLCRRGIGNYSELKWENATLINKQGEKIILCGLLLHGYIPELRQGLDGSPSAFNAYVHLDECLNKCRIDPSHCEHDLWHQGIKKIEYIHF